MVQGTDAPAPPPVDPDKLRRRDPRQPLSYFHFGTPEEVAAKVRAFVVDSPVDTAFFWASLGGMPEKEVAKQVELVCTRLAPLLRDPMADSQWVPADSAGAMTESGDNR
jgi:hypothetical protein